MKTSDINTSRYLFFRRIMTLAMVLMLCFPLSSCSKNNSSSNPMSTASGSQVIMQNTSYNPQTLTVSKGTTVTWINKDPFDHTVTSGTPGNPSGLFDSGDIAPNGQFSYTFNNTGTFNYYCKIHLDRMTGTIIVQ